MEIGTAIAVGLLGLAFFGFFGVAVVMAYLESKHKGETSLRERLKALEMGFPPQDAEIERAKAYARAAWAAGLIGLFVPLALTVAAGALTSLALQEPSSDSSVLVGLIVGWSIAGLVILVTILRSLSTIRHLPAPGGSAPQRVSPPGKRDEPSVAIQEKRLDI